MSGANKSVFKPVDSNDDILNLTELIRNPSKTFKRLAVVVVLLVVLVAALLQHFQLYCFECKVVVLCDDWALWQTDEFWTKHSTLCLLWRVAPQWYHLVFSPCTKQVPTQPPGANTTNPTALQQHPYQTHTAKAKEKPHPHHYPNYSKNNNKRLPYNCNHSPIAPVWKNIQTWLTERHGQCFTKEQQNNGGKKKSMKKGKTGRRLTAPSAVKTREEESRREWCGQHLTASEPAKKTCHTTTQLNKSKINDKNLLKA